MPIHVQSRAGRLRRGVPPPRRPAAGEVHRRDLPRRRRAAELRARPARLHAAPGRASRSPCRARAWAARARRSSSRSSIQLGVQEAPARRHLRRPAAAPQARRPDRRALAPCPADSTAMHLVGNEPHCPTASWELIHGAVHAAKEMGQAMHVGPIVSSDLFYNPDEGQYERWSKRGVLAVEMEAAALFTVGALRGVQAGCLLDRQRHRRRGRVQADLRRRDEGRGRPDDARRARDGDHRSLATPSSSSTRRRPTASTGRRWPEIAHRAATRGLEGDTLFSRAARASSASSRARRPTAARSCSSSSAATAR